MTDSSKICFKLTDNEDDPNRLYKIFFSDKYAIREVFPYEIEAFFGFKDQIKMMTESDYECSFLELVESAKELEKCFKTCLEVLVVKDMPSGGRKANEI